MNKNIFTLFTNISNGNLAFHVTNEKKNVINARKNLCKKYNLNYNNLKYMNQTHSNVVKLVNENDTIYNSDAIITNKLQTPLLVMVADCIPIIFYDEIKKIIAVAHAGRVGTYLDISTNVINKMISDFSSDVKNIKVILGPSIQKCCYEVSENLAKEALLKYGEDVVCNRNVNLQEINKKQLLLCGILQKNITISNICTKCSNKNYFSYRKDNNCGRFAGIISLKK